MAGELVSETRELTHRPLAIGRGGYIDMGLLNEHDTDFCRQEESMASCGMIVRK
jgi:hypothetical protein